MRGDEPEKGNISQLIEFMCVCNSQVWWIECNTNTISRHSRTSLILLERSTKLALVMQQRKIKYDNNCPEREKRSCSSKIGGGHTSLSSKKRASKRGEECIKYRKKGF